MGSNRRIREPDLGYLTVDELPYRQSSAGQACAHWILGGRYPEAHEAWAHPGPDADCGSLAAFGARFDHCHALTPGSGRRVVLNQPYMSLAEHLDAAGQFAEAWGLVAHPVAELIRPNNPFLSSSAVLLAREGVDVDDVVASLRRGWLALVPGATVPSPSRDLAGARTPERASAALHVAGDATGGRP
ncbi:hypothetical protein [Microbacterium sp. ZXX196]|uniref:hypothetical protein n=1 Tax=Microbacterium sp. ZXX196 TaxID=2609291 RepID=UPI0012B934DB|nr:hypothetical protein [Microbacterium sp. ZXX196]MTE22660.1 hypothetical protein [Microbacterium sp. ZXX196]